MKAKALRVLFTVVSSLAVLVAASTAIFACPPGFYYQPKTPKSLVIED